MPTENVNCSPVSLEQNNSTPLFLDMPSQLRVTSKPLEQINIKNLADTPIHLQGMLLQLQNYDITIKYQPGKQMLTLSLAMYPSELQRYP